mmetsp:Transcript_8027/g.12395  ORF Transcript_8027/g.12395 Transcript_8027/m.12395 type:complete len:84 (-) Transcript_8027:292-543(-)
MGRFLSEFVFLLLVLRRELTNWLHVDHVIEGLIMSLGGEAEEAEALLDVARRQELLIIMLIYRLIKIADERFYRWESCLRLHS